MKGIIQVFALSILLIGLTGNASGNEFTEVIDAFDKQFDDPFDLNLSVGYKFESSGGTIRRETTDPRYTPSDWDHFGYVNMFEYKHKRHILDLNLEIGIFRDLSIRFGLPLILNDSREITKHDDYNDNQWGVDDTGADLRPFFNELKSPERSGVDYFTVGLWWSPLAQERDDTKPTWTLFAEGRFGVGDTLKASCAKGEVLANYNEDGVFTAGGINCEDFALGPGDTSGMEYADRGGISRGVNEFHFGTRLSRRYGMLDPYFGFDAMVGFAKDGTDYFIEGYKAGQINTMPPVVGTLDFGMEIIPWEVPEKHRKLAIGIGAGATFHSEGRDYTPLYDVLGTSPYFITQTYVDYNGNGENDSAPGTDPADPDEATAARYWSGMTDIENYATFFGNLFVMIQPAKYIKFRIGGGFAHDTEHFITKTDMCSADKMAILSSAVGLGEAPTECSARNYGHRPELDAPGSRFRAEKTFIGKFAVDVTAMF